jgi:hypothetical protein
MVEKGGTHWTSWLSIEKPKGGGWGLKDIHTFGKSLAAKSLWNPITKDSLWRRITVQKYVAPNSLLDWIRSEGKSAKNTSKRCKVLVSSFPELG